MPIVLVHSFICSLIHTERHNIYSIRCVAPHVNAPSVSCVSSMAAASVRAGRELKWQKMRGKRREKVEVSTQSKDSARLLAAAEFVLLGD